MKNTHDMAGRGQTLLCAAACAWLAAVVFVAAPVAGFAQETTAAIRGTIIGADGAPEDEATVLVIDTRTGRARTATTAESGQFNITGLRVGGPYTVQVQAPGATPQTVTDVFLELGDTYSFDVSLSSGGEDIEEIIVTASALEAIDVAIGPTATFSLAQLQNAPAINRSINDVISIDPRIYVDEGFVDSVQCAGASPRFNSLTVDGVAMNDNFGLNSNGFPTERMPFPYDAIEQIAVELAPFDVMYGNFTACNINAVTKSGTNEFHGGVFYDYTDDSLTGDQLEGDDIFLGSFEEKRYGFTFGGPIVEDRLFFFVAYEKLEGVNVFDRGAADDPTAGRPVLGVSQAQLDRIRDIAINAYGYDPGAFLPSLPNEDEKYLVKLDWNINDSHRAAYTYTFNDGFNNAQADSDGDEYEFSNHFYERGAELNSHVAQLFSNWTQNFSTELRVSYSELDNRQIPLGGTDFGEVQITTFNDPDGAGGISPQEATVYLGADDSRHANELQYDTTGFKVAGIYTNGDHVITGGWERQEFDILNMFIQESEGEYRFETCSAADPDGCIDAFESGDPSRVTYENAAPSNVKEDAVATFGYQINTLYLQDQFPIADGDVSIVAGVRYDWYTSDDLPRENPNFVARNGFSNSQNFDGEGIIQPRLGFNWEFSERLSFRGGVGLYSGGNPNVWLSNNYSNDGITQVECQYDEDSCVPLTPLSDDPASNLFNIPHTGEGEPIFDIPQALFDAVATVPGNSSVNAVDPSFDIPKEWKFALGATWNFDAGFFGDDYVLMLDYLHTEKEDSAVIVDATLEQIGTAPDGRPIYTSIDRSDADCLVNEADPTDGPTSDDCDNRLFSQDFILSNVSGDDGESDVWSFALSKGYDWGLDWTFGYAYTVSTEVSPMTSSVAFSNYANASVSDPNDPDPADSNYEIPNRFTLRLNFSRAFFGNNLTTITLYGRVNEGRPYSPTFVDGGFTFGDTIDDRHLLYIPAGADDPNVAFAPGFDQQAFFNYIASSGLDEYAGEIAPRNSLQSDWWHKYDLRIEQELPGFAEEHNFAGFLIIENLGNLINDDWGVMREQSFPRNLPLVEFSIDSATNQYVYEAFRTPPPLGRVADASLWEMRLGVSYDF